LTVRDGALYFADIASPHTISNLKLNPAIEINVVDVFQRRGYRFTGRALILPSDHQRRDQPAHGWLQLLTINGAMRGEPRFVVVGGQARQEAQVLGKKGREGLRKRRIVLGSGDSGVEVRC
jgi:hypothetical protein